MATRTHTPDVINPVTGDLDKHPPGLYVLFATEMWERFGFYTMVAMFTLYLRDEKEGFGWSAAEASTLYANYQMFVYASPLLGGWLADKYLGYRRAVMIGAVFFMAGYLMLYVHSLPVLYTALTFLVIGNGLFKPNVSTMVGNLYPDGSRLKDRAYNLFYMGINIGAFLAPISATIVQAKFGFRPGFTVAALGMVLSLAILWRFKHYVEEKKKALTGPREMADAAATTADAPPAGISRQSAMDAVPEWKRIGALVVVFLVVIVFWMVFHQNGTTITFWADENTAWNVRGIISNAINPGWVILLTVPLITFWRWLDKKGKEPSTPTKMAFGMAMTALAFFIFFLAAKSGEATVTGSNIYAYKVSPAWLVGAYGVLTLGELMLSPMGLSLVSKVAPTRLRGFMMGGWFFATAMGNKLTQIAVFWTKWPHSTFWIVLSGLALVMAVVLLVLLRPLKKAMPGV
ncbi:MAG TPA: peptide MFS transporter [Blastocatellia bacterium]|nr:peptide MFS transporter [Blastocatellia bacterium]